MILRRLLEVEAQRQGFKTYKTYIWIRHIVVTLPVTIGQVSHTLTFFVNLVVVDHQMAYNAILTG